MLREVYRLWMELASPADVVSSPHGILLLVDPHQTPCTTVPVGLRYAGDGKCKVDFITAKACHDNTAISHTPQMKIGSVFVTIYKLGDMTDGKGIEGSQGLEIICSEGGQD